MLSYNNTEIDQKLSIVSQKLFLKIKKVGVRKKFFYFVYINIIN